MDIREGLIATPTEEEVTRITQGLKLKNLKTREDTALHGPVLPRNAEVNLYTYEQYRIPPVKGPVGRPEKPPAQRPVRVVWFTSIRDVGRFDLNGTDIAGVIETVNKLINEGTKLKIDGEEGVRLGDFIRIRGVITDDLRTENLGHYPLTPKSKEPWIHPLDAKNDEGNLLTKITEHIPSDFRAIPKGDHQLRKQKRLEFENKVYEVSQQMGADILISDHLMIRLIHLIKENRYGIGRILNIHPGISDTRNPHRLPGSTPTLDAIDRANWNAVFDKRKKLFLPANPEANRFATGATLHVIDKGVDRGPVIADSESTVVFKDDRPRRLRRRNYPLKRAVLVRGIIHYVRTMLDNIDKINFGSGERQMRKSTITQE